MATPINIQTGNIPLSLARKLTTIVNQLWESGEYLNKVTPTTASLLKYWFSEAHCENRFLNFHKGQRQAILNTIYLHEIIKIDSVLDIYEAIDKDLLLKLPFELFAQDKYKIPKYGIKMATGTGKTWVMNAFFIWQYLNATEENIKSGRYSKNFLFVAPGVIVYDRLLDSYLGKENEDGTRDIDTSDIVKNQELFLPENFRTKIKAFLQNSVVKKDEIGKKITSDGMIAITNWHLLMGKDEQEDDKNPLQDPSGVIKDIFPARPGTASGNALENLDNAYFSGGEIEYLANLDDLVVMNDEAHHIHENKIAGVIQEVEWQKSLNFIAQNKIFLSQIDFSATPYDTTGSGQKRTKHYFPHIIVDFDLNSAISQGLVKMITIDKRKELSTLELDFKAIRDSDDNKGKVIALSDGQKVMIQAGLKKLDILEQEFIEFDKNKYPKMLIMCEDTTVVPFVEEYLSTLDLKDDEVMSVHSDKKGNMKPQEWLNLKQKLFNVDKLSNPKVIVSVLMLREGFDVSNICVIVPLRSSQASILLEQTIGRGLRLMWREPEYNDIKKENLQNVLVKKQAPKNYIDVLSIIEHPAFNEFYDDLIDEGIVAEDDGEFENNGTLGDMINVGLKENYQDYDMFFPEILQDEDEELITPNLDINSLVPYTYHNLEQLKLWTTKGEVFHSQEITVKTNFGEYKINADLFKANNYNEYLSKILSQITHTLGKTKQKGHSRSLPLMQINQAVLVGIIDNYIRNKLFNESFNPFENESWRVLMLKGANITEHIIKEISRAVYNMQNETIIVNAQVEKNYFSSIKNLRMRESYSLDLEKTIYQKTSYPSNKGGFEKSFLEFLDSDTKVDKFIKIDEYKHLFARVFYFRDDGLMGWYSPDFMVSSDDSIYLIETKSDKDLKDINVKQKQKATVDFVNRINKLDEDLRDNKIWSYLLLGETQFYSLKNSGADIQDIARVSKINEALFSGNLFDM
jgi:type III restriction enzyme